MYTQAFEFFGLRENPFKTSPSFVFVNQKIQSVLDELANGIESGKGLLVLTGEVGTGKTTVLKRLMAWLDEQRVLRAYIYNPHLEPNELFELMLTCFGAPLKARQPGDARHRLNLWLADQRRRGEKAVLIVDEAQELPLHVLEEVRLLLNHETMGERSLQVVLCGQPEFDETLRRSDMRQIRQRIEVRSRTAAFDRHETHAYIQTLLDVAGAGGRPAFAMESADAIHFYARGTPRVINLICESSLLHAGAQKLRPIPAEIVDQVARELQFDELRPVAGRKSASDSDWSNPILARPLEGGASDSAREKTATLVPISGTRIDFSSHAVTGRGASQSCATGLDTPDTRFVQTELPKRWSVNPRGFEPVETGPRKMWVCDNPTLAERLSEMWQRSLATAKEDWKSLFATVAFSFASSSRAVRFRFSSTTNWVRERAAVVRQWIVSDMAPRHKGKPANSMAIPLRTDTPSARQYTQVP